jgi:hypothetical protein
MLNSWRLIFSIVCILLQSVPLLIAYIGWKKDCKTIGKERLAVPLSGRIWAGLICFPFWIGPIIAYGS